MPNAAPILWCLSQLRFERYDKIAEADRGNASQFENIGKAKMRTFVAVILLVGLVPAVAQNTPKSIKTLRLQTASVPLYMIDRDGTIRIDWRHVEAVAQSAKLTDSDIARVLIAVRDGKVQAMP